MENTRTLSAPEIRMPVPNPAGKGIPTNPTTLITLGYLKS